MRDEAPEPATWITLHSDAEWATRELSGWGARIGIGAKPALLVIDVVRKFTGVQGESLATSIATYRQSCGPAAWQSIPWIVRLLEAARERSIPVIFTRGAEVRRDLRTEGPWRKSARAPDDASEQRASGNEFLPEIGPRADEMVLEKTKPSAFFGTPLMSQLHLLGVDHLIVAGTTTSGCVRATVTDAFSYNLGVSVVAECVFDRFPTSHNASLFDMDAKFADVVSLDELILALGRAHA